jgi:hypothetical protein
MNTRSIFALLAAIRIEQLQSYLANRGWLEQTASGRVTFEKQAEQAGELHVIFLPANQAHPKYRSFLQNLMFSLAVIEQREPCDIATEIIDIHIPAPTPPVSRETSMHEIASLILGLAQQSQESEQAKGRIFSLAKMLLAPLSLTFADSSTIAEDLWIMTRSDHADLPERVLEWLHANTQKSI